LKILKGFALTILSILLFLSLILLGAAVTVDRTALNPHFITTEVNKLDMTSLAQEVLNDPAVNINLSPEAKAALVTAIQKYEPQVKAEVGATIDLIYDYLLGRIQSLDLNQFLESTFLSSGFITSIIGNEGAAALASISQELAQANRALEQARQVIGYFRLGYALLILFVLLLILGIVLIHRQVRGSTRNLGIIFAVYGALQGTGILIARQLIPAQLTFAGLPSALQQLLPEVYNDLLAPLEIFSLGFLIGGVVLLVISFLYRPRQPSS
jgi:hypothetical protein